jgi:hypothetical protein
MQRASVESRERFARSQIAHEESMTGRAQMQMPYEDSVNPRWVRAALMSH